MSHYLDSDGLRRQANSVVRLTVVTIFGMAGSLATAFIGADMLVAEAVSPGPRTFYFLLVLLLSLAIVVVTVLKSKRLADFLEALSDERLPTRHKLGAFLRVWGRRGR
jgi:hypothetical protein